MIYELLAFGTDSRWDDVRYREYTSSKRRAERFAKIERIQFTDNGHGVVFVVNEHRGKRGREIRTVSDHVFREEARIRKEEKWPPELAAVVHAARMVSGGPFRGEFRRSGIVSSEDGPAIAVRHESIENLRKALEAAVS